MCFFFTKVKKYDDVTGRVVTTRCRLSDHDLHCFYRDLLEGDVYRIEEIHIERIDEK